MLVDASWPTIARVLIGIFRGMHVLHFAGWRRQFPVSACNSMEREVAAKTGGLGEKTVEQVKHEKDWKLRKNRQKFIYI